MDVSIFYAFNIVQLQQDRKQEAFGEEQNLPQNRKLVFILIRIQTTNIVISSIYITIRSNYLTLNIHKLIFYLNFEPITNLAYIRYMYLSVDFVRKIHKPTILPIEMESELH